MTKRLTVIIMLAMALLLFSACEEGEVPVDMDEPEEQVEPGEPLEEEKPVEKDDPSCRDEPLEPLDPDPAEPDQPGEPVVLPDELPAEVQAWIDESRSEFGAWTLNYEGILYLLVTYGVKPTGGYEVEITEIEVGPGEVEVTVYFREPGPDEMVTQALTEPYDLAMLDDPGLPVRFTATGAETEVPAR